MKIEGCSICDTPVYCVECGVQLLVFTKIHTMFDYETGELIQAHYHYWKCPSTIGLLNFLNRFSHTTHDDVPTGF